ncbi:MAG: glycosyltransferase family 39 protein [Rhizobiaceae bacterium]|nr:glycosyltransferase family 39 protein [Rhizobiaceae bacterium]
MRVVLLALFALLMSVPGISELPPLDRDEPRYLQATKQMVASGDLVDIRFQEESRYKKPVGIYWLQTAAVTISGSGAETPIWVYRLVSVAAVVIAVLGVYWTGAALFGAKAGLIAALVLGSLFGVAFEGRIAKTDAMLLAFTVLAQGALAQIHFSARAKTESWSGLPWVFWIAQGCGILIKGPITLLASVLTILALLVIERDGRWLARLRPLRGGLLMSLIVLPWLVLITVESGGAFWQESVGRDLLGKVVEGQESHGFPPGYFALTYSLFFWPFGLMAIGAGLAAMNRMAEHPALRFCLAWYIPFWVVFEAIPTKLPHYTLPAFPALALLIGWAATLPLARSVVPLRRWQTALWWLSAFGLAVVTAAIVVVALGAAPILTGTFAWIGIPIAGFAVAAAWLAVPRALDVSLTRIIGAAASAGAAYALFFALLAPSLQTIWLSPRIADASARLGPCPTSTLAAVGYHEPSLVFLAGTDTLLTDVEGAANHLLADPACAIAVLPADERARLAELLQPSGRTAAAVQAIEGVNFSNGKTLSLDLVTLTPP